jgi:hypothetical protein
VVKQLYADFDDVAEDGALRLSCAGTVASIAELGQELREREEVCFTDGNRFAVGRVHRRGDGTWEGRATSELVHLPPPGLEEPGETVRRALFPEPAPAADDARPYRPPPPLWRALAKKRSPYAIGLGLIGALALTALLAVAYELHFFSGPAKATPMTVTAIERMHQDSESPAHLVYVVKLPDGSTARFTSERTYGPGTRLVAMVSTGWLTRRTLVGPPYVVMPDE